MLRIAHPPVRVRHLAPLLALVGALLAPPAGATTVLPQPARDRGLDLYVAPFAQLPDAPDGTGPARMNTMTRLGDRLFVSTEQGQVYEITGGKAVLRYDVEARLPAVAGGRHLNRDNPQHGGLRGFAFSPTFATDHKVYTSFMEDRPSSTAGHHYLSDVPNPVSADSVLAEWTLGASGTLSDATYRELFRVGMPVYDHPIKEILFGPDGLLYIAHGDGSVQSAVAGGGMAKDALGKILRIDPHPSAGLPYTIPADNPFVGSSTMIPEAWSIGHRNPHTLSFTPQGDLIDTEVGRDNVDEVNLIKRGANYGWPEREGTFVQLPVGGIGLGVGVSALPSDDAKYGYTYPVAEVSHDGPSGAGFIGIGLAGGYPVTNGSPLDGEYLYGEFATQGQIYHSNLAAMRGAVTKGDPSQLTQTSAARARVYFDDDADPSTPAQQKASMLDVINDDPGYIDNGRADLRFGQGSRGELYLTSKTNDRVYLIESSLPGGPGGFTAPRTRVEAESGTLLGTATVGREHTGFSAYGYVDFLTDVGAGVDGLAVRRDEAGLTKLSITYTAGNGGPAGTRTMGVFANGTRVGTASFAPTDGWDAYAVANVTVPLAAGTNTIKLQRTSSDTGWVNLDDLEYTDEIAPAPPVVRSSVEAEAGTLVGGATVTTQYPGYTGTGAVGGFSKVGAGVTGMPILRPSDRAMDVRVRYAAGGASTARTLTLSTGFGNPQQLTLPATGSWTTYKTVEVPIAIGPGTQSLSLTMQSADTGDVVVDSLRLIAVPPVIEAETGTRSGGAGVLALAGSRGAGSVVIVRPGAKLDGLRVNRSAAGPTTITVRYSAGVTTGPRAGRSLTLSVDGVPTQRVAFPVTPDDTTFRTLDVSVPLTAGSHTIGFSRATADTGFVAIDSIQPALILEAEAGTPYGGAVLGSTHGTPSGTGYVEYLTTAGAGVRDLSLVRNAAGTATIGIVYSSGTEGPQTPRQASILVSGKVVATATFPQTGSWATYRTLEVPVPLAAGDNPIEIRVADGDVGWINVDAITN